MSLKKWWEAALLRLPRHQTLKREHETATRALGEQSLRLRDLEQQLILVRQENQDLRTQVQEGMARERELYRKWIDFVSNRGVFTAEQPTPAPAPKRVPSRQYMSRLVTRQNRKFARGLIEEANGT